MARPTLSLVLPVYNEQEVIPILHERLQSSLSKLAVDTEVIFVDDGSTDRSLILLRELVAQDPRYKVISFSRNFGHGTAITAGVDYARGEAVVIMDADLQDPPEVIGDMMDRWREGYDVVYGHRLTREGETRFKLITSRWFYRLLRALVPLNVPLDTGDFRLMSRQVVITLRALRETHRFIRGMVSWVGFRQTAVFYDRPSRAAGETKYPLGKMLRLAMDAITSFSVLPLRVAAYLGMLISVGSVAVAIWAVVEHYAFGTTVPGWTATVVLVSLLSSVQLLMIGILGEYIGRIYEQVKGRPLYLVGETLNLPRTVDTDEFEPRPHVELPSAIPTALPTPQSAPTVLLVSPPQVGDAPQVAPAEPLQTEPHSPLPSVPSESPLKEASAPLLAGGAPASPPSTTPPHAPAPRPSRAPAAQAPPSTAAQAPPSTAAQAPPSTAAQAPPSTAAQAPPSTAAQAPPSTVPPRRSMPPPVPPPRSRRPLKGTLMGIMSPSAPVLDSTPPPPPIGPASHGIDVPPPSATASPASTSAPPGTPVSPAPGAPLPPQLVTAPIQPIPSASNPTAKEPGSK